MQRLHIVYSEENDTYDIMWGGRCVEYFNEASEASEWLESNGYEPDFLEPLVWWKE